MTPHTPACALAALTLAGAACAADLATPVGAGEAPAPPWRYVGLPTSPPPPTRFEVVSQLGTRALRIEAIGSYGNLLHSLPPGTPAGTLSWRAQVTLPLQGAALTTRRGDDAALKVCAMFDMPLEKVPLIERQLLRLARSRSDQALPTATLCYVWDAALPVGSVVVNPYTRRVRSIVVHAPVGQWQTERHDLASDFARLFGDEANQVPPVTAILIGADADNTGSRSLAYLSAIQHAAP